MRTFTLGVSDSSSERRGAGSSACQSADRVYGDPLSNDAGQVGERLLSFRRGIRAGLGPGLP